MEEVKKKLPKAERMAQHIIDSCESHGRPPIQCEFMANVVVSKWKERQKKKHESKKTPMSK